MLIVAGTIFGTEVAAQINSQLVANNRLRTRVFHRGVVSRVLPSPIFVVIARPTAVVEHAAPSREAEKCNNK